MTDKKETSGDKTREFNENPFSPDKKPEDIVRLFYEHDLPIIPVVSKRGILLGVLKKERVISELSDIERAKKLKIDKFITKTVCRMALDDLLPYGKIKKFVVINIFGEVQGDWTRLQFFSAVDPENGVKQNEAEQKDDTDDQSLEWIIYLILEHIPRPLYAVNTRGKTIFYNSHFEELCEEKLSKKIVIEEIEKMFKGSEKNELISERDSGDLKFFNSELAIVYEKVPLSSKGKKIGFLIFCDYPVSEAGDAGADAESQPLKELMDSYERDVLVKNIRLNKNNLKAVSDNLKISRKSLLNRIEKYNIVINKTDEKK